MNNQITKNHLLDSTLANNLIALINENNLPFNVEAGKSINGDINVSIKYGKEDEELLNSTLNDAINAL